ncbi:AraC family transcriptional regulator [Paenibacillus sp. J5C_2022]|uniref:AraC family transcriptional regulator n=1 Tax=Paenibacillus sp. J5C2022 TaxID=2977129 RepID=UPI0021D17380|nr:AraC family transcriptional regulator [Paenibacillus sp. J5C2022]MCU6713132.1 AraC family transcriptional regulator [Paenibacillus sp. J5C2022]
MFILGDTFHIDHLRMRINWIRNMDKSASFAFDRIRIPYTLIWLVLEGRLQVEINGQRLWAEPGDLIMCPPNTQFGLVPRHTGERIHYLSFCADLKIGNMDLLPLYGLPSYWRLEPSEGVERWKREWLALVDTFDRFGELVNKKTASDEGKGKNTYLLHTDITIHYMELQGLIFRWVQHWLTVLRDKLPDEPLRFDHRVMQVCDYVRDRLDKPLRLQELAEHVHISTSQLCHLFSEVLGTSPMELVRTMRLEQAKVLLMNNELTLREIAERIGYEDQSQLSRAFRQSEGISPSQYRKNVLASPIN